jgi:uncharacterized membrane protein YhiD involved in acid resistance
MGEINGRRYAWLQWVLGGVATLVLTLCLIILNSQDRRIASAEDKINRNTLYKEEVSDHDKDIQEVRTLIQEQNKELNDIYKLLLEHDRRTGGR